MRKLPAPHGYTLIEIIIAIVVLSMGVLVLAASSGVVARAMAANALRERGGRIAASRIELIQSECRIARSGEETSHLVHSQWLVASDSRSLVGVVESVTYPALGGSHTDIYRATIWCPR
ncbi:MAG: type II secretion system protein [Gemmatimonadaceae bacterium]